MKKIGLILAGFLLISLGSCGGGEEKKEDEKVKIGQTTKKEVVEKVEVVKASEMIDLTNKGVGPIASLTLPETIDNAMATNGAEVFKTKCMACHKPDKKFIGPAPTGIMERRTPEWIMNMILDPEGMVAKDPLAKQLLVEFNGSPMANQNLTEEEARAILEYFRTL
ncbi:MAG: cytochrome c [Flavobacteriaceae bacterium]|nr:cytochrome c [Flavobacteriaceae bacterium]